MHNGHAGQRRRHVQLVQVVAPKQPANAAESQAERESQSEAPPAHTKRPSRQAPVDKGHSPVDVVAHKWKARKAHLHAQGRRGQTSEAVSGTPRAQLAGPWKRKSRQRDSSHRAACVASNHVKIDPVNRAGAS